MINIALRSPFKYLEECLNANLLRGISTTLIESGILNKLTLYCPGNHCNNIEKGTLIDHLNSCKEDFDRHIRIQTLEDDIIDLDSDSFCSQVDLVQERKEIQSIKVNKILDNNVGEARLNRIIEEDKLDVYQEASSYYESSLASSGYNQNRGSEWSKNSTKCVRWGKKHDKVLWSVLKELEKTSKESYDIITSIGNIDVSEHRRLLSSICKKSKWNGSHGKFIKRVKKITRKKGFSFRENKKLRYLFRKGIANKKIDLESIVKEFPGKERSTILSELKKIKSQYKIMKTYRFLMKEYKKFLK